MTFVHMTMEKIILPEPYPCTRPVLSRSIPALHVHNNTLPILCASDLWGYNCRSTGTWQSQDLTAGNLVQDSLLSVLHRINRGRPQAWHFSALGPQLVNWQVRKSFGQSMKPFPWVYPTEHINAVTINNHIRASPAGRAHPHHSVHEQQGLGAFSFVSELLTWSWGLLGSRETWYLYGRTFLSSEVIPPCSPCNFLPKFELPFTIFRIKIQVAKGWLIAGAVILVPSA